MGIYTDAVQKLYVAYFSRPADAAGLTYWENVVTAANGDTSAVSAAFAASQEYTDTFAGQSQYQIINTIYLNLFGRAAEPAALAFWGQGLINGSFTVDEAVTTIAGAAQTTDLTAYNNKVTAATAFTTALDTSDEILGYSGTAANNAAKSFIAGVTTDASLTAATAPAALNAAVTTVVSAGQNASGQVFNLTEGPDAIVGTNGNDIINATIDNMGGFDTIDGGAGTDTLSVLADAALAAGAFSGVGVSVKNIETLSVRNIAATSLNAADTGMFKTVSINTVGAGNAVSVIGGASTTTVNTTGGSTVTISGANVNAASVTSSTGTATLNTDKLAVLNLATQTGDVIVNAAAGTRALTVNANGLGVAGTPAVPAVPPNASVPGDTGTPAVDAVPARGTNVTDATATSVIVNGNGAASSINLAAAAATALTVNSVAAVNLTGSAAAATTLTITGAGKTTIGSMTAGKLATVDASAATGDVAMGNLGATVLTVKGGAGKDSVGISATTKVTVDTGAGNDTVTLNSALAAGSTINLGAGSDKLVKGTGSIAASTTTAATSIDGGEGVDTIAAGLITAGNATLFKNFEVLGLDASTLDISLVTGTTFTALEVLAGGGTYSNVTTAQALAVNSTGVTGTTTLGFTNVAGAADSYTVAFGGNSTATAAAAGNPAIAAGTVSLAGIETINIISNAATGFTNNSITLAGTAAQTVTVTGNQSLDLDFAANFGSVTGKGVTAIDGSAATGSLDINTANVVAATTGLTVTGGTAADIISIGNVATVNAGAGNDVITVAGKFSSTLTGGAGNDSFNVSAVTGTSTVDLGAGPVVQQNMTTITDFTAGDSIVFSGSTTFGATAVNVSTATTLQAALNLAAAGTTGTNVTWFTYGANTYVVEDNGTGTTFGADDIVVMLTGNIDLATATIANNTITL